MMAVVATLRVKFAACVTIGVTVGGRGLHSSSFRLNVSAFCGIGGV